MNKKLIFLTPILLCLILCLTPAAGMKEVQAKGNPKLSKSSLYLYNKKGQTLKLKNANKKVTWTIDDKKVAKIKKTTGKYGQKVTVIPRKSGSCHLIATMNGKKYYCNLYVYKSNYKKSKTKLYVSKVTQSANKQSIVLTVKLCNGSASKTLGFFEEYSVKRYVNGKWETVKMKEEIAFIEPYYEVLPKTSQTHTIALEHCFDISKFTPGTYQLRFGADLPEQKRLLQFTIK